MQTSFGSMEMEMRVKREASRAGGQEPINPLIMFKAILLGQWHSLSDPKQEEALRVRIDFMSEPI